MNDKIQITKVNAYSRQYVKPNEIVHVEGYTAHGHPFITSKSEQNNGHKVVFIIGDDCEVVQ